MPDLATYIFVSGVSVADNIVERIRAVAGLVVRLSLADSVTEPSEAEKGLLLLLELN